MAEVEIEVEDYTIQAEVEWKYVGHSGIGPYEYWGSMYYDYGHPEYEIKSTILTLVVDPDGNEVDLTKISKEQEEIWIDLIEEKAEPEIED